MKTNLGEDAKARFLLLREDNNKFLERFDLDQDGVLQDDEIAAALKVLQFEILREEKSDVLPHRLVDLRDAISDRYCVLSIIGEGAQSQVYVARNLNDKKIVVIKHMKVGELNDWETLQSFERESEILAGLSHSNIPKLVDSFTIEVDGETQSIGVQEFKKGESVDQQIKDGMLFNEQMLVLMASQILEVLSYLHQQTPPVIHRDIKPSNLLSNEDGTISLIDFGAVQYVTKNKTMAIGTTGYMPMEQITGNATPQSDLYALGVTLVYLATGRGPLSFETRRSKLDWVAFSSLSDGFSDWIDRLIHPSLSSRTSNAEDALSTLQNLGKEQAGINVLNKDSASSTNRALTKPFEDPKELISVGDSSGIAVSRDRSIVVLVTPILSALVLTWPGHKSFFYALIFVTCVISVGMILTYGLGGLAMLWLLGFGVLFNGGRKCFISFSQNRSREFQYRFSKSGVDVYVSENTGSQKIHMDLDELRANPQLHFDNISPGDAKRLEAEVRKSTSYFIKKRDEENYT